MNDDLRLIFANAKVYRLEKQLDAVSAGAKWLREELDSVTNRLTNKVDMQSAILNMIATYGTDNPTWAAKIAKAAVEGEK